MESFATEENEEVSEEKCSEEEGLTEEEKTSPTLET